MTRALLLLLIAAAPAFCWVESVEFPWAAFPKPLWERELVWLKNIGVQHVSLPAPAAQTNLPPEFMELLRLLRRINLEADIEGRFPQELQPFTRAHGGPLLETLPQPASRISALQQNALIESRKLLETGNASIIWTDVESTISPSAFHAGAVTFAGDETLATIPIRRNAQLLHFWGETFPTLHLVPGPAAKLSPLAPAKSSTISISQFVSDTGLSSVSLSNPGKEDFEGELRVLFPPAKHTLSIPNVVLPAGNSLLLPVNVPIGGTSLCKACSAFAASDHLVYATAELTAMEYENGILAMEFSAPAPAEVILQLTREPSGPYVAGGKPTEFDWDPGMRRARLTIPKGKGAGDRVRVGIAIEPPEATAFFDSAKVLLIGETNNLTAQFSSEQIAKRSRLIVPPGFTVSQSVKSPLEITYQITVPDTAVHGDHADLAIEGDGTQLSHSRPQLLRAASLRFGEAVGVTLGTGHVLPVFPATIPVNARSGRELTIFIRNNAPEIRNFDLHLAADGLDFSPASMKVTVGASAVREVTFRVFPTGAESGLHEGAAVLSGAAYFKEPLRFLVLPGNGSVAWNSNGFAFLESARVRATFLGSRWIEYIEKEKNENRLPASVELPAGARPPLGQLELRIPKLPVKGRSDAANPAK